MGLGFRGQTQHDACRLNSAVCLCVARGPELLSGQRTVELVRLQLLFDLHNTVTPGRCLPYGSRLGLSRCLGPGECLHSFNTVTHVCSVGHCVASHLGAAKQWHHTGPAAQRGGLPGAGTPAHPPACLPAEELGLLFLSTRSLPCSSKLVTSARWSTCPRRL